MEVKKRREKGERGGEGVQHLCIFEVVQLRLSFFTYTNQNINNRISGKAACYAHTA